MLRKITAILVVAAAVPVGMSAAPSGAAQVAGRTTLCGHNEHLLVHNPGEKNSYLLRTPSWHGKGTVCVRNVGRRPNLRVIRTPRPGPGFGVTSFPAIMRGCYWNACTPDGALPIRVSHIRHAASTWHTPGEPRGTWNKAYDIWFTKHRETRGHPDGAELMIWFDHHGQCCALASNARRLRIDGREWLLTHWLARDGSINKPYSGITWNYIQFRATHRMARANRLGLKPFIRAAERRGLIRQSWWMENIQAGYEIWSGGVGLRTTAFRATVY